MIKKLLLGSILLMQGVSAHPQKVVIWDLGGVLLSNSKLTYINAIGLKPIASYMMTERTAPWNFSKNVQQRVFEVLQRVLVDEHVIEGGSCIPGGIAMPPVLWAFQAGLINAEECVKRAEAVITELHATGYFNNDAEKELVRRIITATFTPALSVSSCSVRTETMKIVKQLAAQKYADGTKKYKLIVLSNWDPWSFVHIRKKFAHELSYFDDVIISGDIKLMKPTQAIFAHVFKKHHLLKDQCVVFIDDQLENIKGAASFGIRHPIHFTNSLTLRQQLRRLKI